MLKICFVVAVVFGQTVLARDWKPVEESFVTKVRRGDVFSKPFTREGASWGDINRIYNLLEDFYGRSPVLRVGHSFTMKLRCDEELGCQQEDRSRPVDYIVWHKDWKTDVIIYREWPDNQFEVVEEDIPLRKEEYHFNARIEKGSSFFEALSRQKIPIDGINKMARVLGGRIDFQRDVHLGNEVNGYLTCQLERERGEITYPVKREGVCEVQQVRAQVGYGSDESYEMFKYRHNDFDYYFDEQGRSGTFLLKTPIDGARLSSGYGDRRHPTLGYNKLHAGLDFAARRGTPIYAAGHGVIEKRYVSQTYGKYIRIRHANGYKTAYAHMSRYAKKQGDRVRQGEVIGYVGSTGRSTGAHLHYEVIKDGRKVNPRRLKFQPDLQLQGEDLEDFQERVRVLRAQSRPLS